MAPPLCLPSPTLGKWGSVCLLFWKASWPVYHCQSTETHRKSGIWGGVCCPICPALSFAATGPTWRVPRPGPIHLHLCLLGTDSLCVGSLQPPRYVSALLTGAWVRLLTRQWREIQVRQCLTGLRPTHAPAYPSCAFVDSGLIFERQKLGLTTAYPLSPQIYCQTVTWGVLNYCPGASYFTFTTTVQRLVFAWPIDPFWNWALWILLIWKLVETGKYEDYFESWKSQMLFIVKQALEVEVKWTENTNTQVCHALFSAFCPSFAVTGSHCRLHLISTCINYLQALVNTCIDI